MTWDWRLRQGEEPAFGKCIKTDATSAREDTEKRLWWETQTTARCDLPIRKDPVPPPTKPHPRVERFTPVGADVLRGPFTRQGNPQSPRWEKRNVTSPSRHDTRTAMIGINLAPSTSSASVAMGAADHCREIWGAERRSSFPVTAATLGARDDVNKLGLIDGM